MVGNLWLHRGQEENSSDPKCLFINPRWPRSVMDGLVTMLYIPCAELYGIRHSNNCSILSDSIIIGYIVFHLILSIFSIKSQLISLPINYE